jgi:outer membrane murein-binding lipoprotein Lpp
VRVLDTAPLAAVPFWAPTRIGTQPHQAGSGAHSPLPEVCHELHHRYSCLVSSGLIGLALLAGCKSTGADKVDQTSTRLEQFKSSVGALKGQVGSTADSLTNVVESGSSDPKPAFKEFDKQVDAVSGSVAKARTNLEKAQTEGAKLFDEWTKRLDTITDPEIRKSSEKRRSDLQAALEPRVRQDRARHGRARLVRRLRQGPADLPLAGPHAGGIEAISGKSKDLSKKASSISKDLDEVIEEVTKVANQFATAKPPPAPAK